MGKSSSGYIPVLSFHWLTPYFDILSRLTFPELAFKNRLIRQANIQNGFRILDLGCGTGTLALMIKKSHPGAEVVGFDADRKALEIAKSKMISSDLQISLDRGLASKLPYPDGSFDRVFSSLVFHHLNLENKTLALGEVKRILKPDGEFHLADFGPPRSILMYPVSMIMIHFEEARDNFKGLLPKLMTQAGFESIEETSQYLTIFGQLLLYRVKKSFAK